MTANKKIGSEPASILGFDVAEVLSDACDFQGHALASRLGAKVGIEACAADLDEYPGPAPSK